MEAISEVERTLPPFEVPLLIPCSSTHMSVPSLLSSPMASWVCDEVTIVARPVAGAGLPIVVKILKIRSISPQD